MNNERGMRDDLLTMAEQAANTLFDEWDRSRYERLGAVDRHRRACLAFAAELEARTDAKEQS